MSRSWEYFRKPEERPRRNALPCWEQYFLTWVKQQVQGRLSESYHIVDISISQDWKMLFSKSPFESNLTQEGLWYKKCWSQGWERFHRSFHVSLVYTYITKTTYWCHSEILQLEKTQHHRSSINCRKGEDSKPIWWNKCDTQNTPNFTRVGSLGLGVEIIPHDRK